MKHMTKYYFCCSYPLKAGSIVESGNWGRIEKIDGLHKVEQTFEKIRKTEFRDRPSRLSCIFLCTSAPNARNFVSLTKRRYDLIYEAELVNPKARIFEADWSWVNRDHLDTEVKAESAARNYWKPVITDSYKTEILAESDVKVGNRVKI